ncbi:hypothetical protein Pmani_030558 [Petrolisthes manimaculis]|uniref:Uncharacterized protein n=1 Tax=Petrolisthes manimaculis TaxID=1843537 RepID=A0AAE1TTG8_9EUCA|nr:hypothetical protein Pmani_030558 [Petrolisthes manimaculis]
MTTTLRTVVTLVEPDVGHHSPPALWCPWPTPFRSSLSEMALLIPGSHMALLIPGSQNTHPTYPYLKQGHI